MKDLKDDKFRGLPGEDGYLIGPEMTMQALCTFHHSHSPVHRFQLPEPSFYAS